MADTGCVLAKSCDSCTRESKEDELADMGCVLARVATAVLMSQKRKMS